MAVAAKLPAISASCPDGEHVVRAVGVVDSRPDPDIDVDTKWGGAKTFFGGEGLFLLKCSGVGDVLVSSYGAILERRIDAGQSYVIDTGHVVAFPEGMRYGVEKAGSWKSPLRGRRPRRSLRGTGSVWLQTRSPQDLIGWVNQHIRTTGRRRSGLRPRVGLASRAEGAPSRAPALAVAQSSR